MLQAEPECTSPQAAQKLVQQLQTDILVCKAKQGSSETTTKQAQGRALRISLASS
jgi:hypothetical protein